jgi:hypothetical protein
MIALVLLVQTAVPAGQRVATGADTSAVHLPRVEAEVVVDGQLDEAVWSQAVRLTGFHQYAPVDGRPSELATDVLVWYSRDAIHFGIMATDDPSSVRVTVSDRDRLGTNDRVTIYLDTFNDQRRAFFFGVNPFGDQEDGVRTEGTGTAGNAFGGNIDRNPDYLWDSKGTLTDTGYQVELRIPFKSLRFPNTDVQRWGLNIVRFTQRTGYEDTWTDVRRANASFLAQSGAIDGMHDLNRGIVTEVQPFLTVTADGAPSSTGQQFIREDPDPDVGVNVRIGMPAVSINASVNPDFSQVESDVGQVTVNERFALFFPEARPFFLEGIELFATPNQLVYTRRIATPIVGAKISGKLGRFNLAYLTAVDELPDSNAWFNIARLRQDVGTEGSTVGATITTFDRGATFNRVAAADARILFGELYFVQAQAGASWTGDGTKDVTAAITELTFDRTGRSWGFNYSIKGIGTDFQARSGFVNRNDIVDGHLFNRLSFYGGRGALLENFTTFFGPRRIWDYRGFGVSGPIEGGEDINLSFQLRGDWNVGSQLSRNFVSFDRRAYAAYTVDRGGTITGYTPPQELDNMASISLNARTPTFQAFNASLSTTYGEVPIFAEASPGHELRVSANLALRITNSIRIDALAVASQIWRQRDGSQFAKTFIPRLRLVYQPTRALFFRIIAEYRSERQDALYSAVSGDPILVDGVVTTPSEFNGMQVNFLASYEPTPGTVAFFGYGADMESPTSLGVSDLTRSRDGFFIKLAYLFRR